MAQQQKVRRLVLTGAVTLITATGAWYGAGLKTKQEMKKEVKARREATPAEIIAQLEEARGVLVAKRIGLERKIQGLEARRNGRGGEEAASVGREGR